MFEPGSVDKDGNIIAGTLKIKPQALKGVEYRFNIEPGSTMKINKAKQLQELERFIDNLGKFQNIIKDDPRIQVHPDKIAQAFGSLADIEGANEFITVSSGPSPQELELQQQLQDAQQQLQTVQQQLEAAKAEPKPTMTPIGGKVFTDPHVTAAAQELMR